MSFFNNELRTYTSEMSSVQRYKLPSWCYKHIDNFCTKYFKNSSNDTVVFPDQTFMPNRLKFNYKYRKGILINKIDFTNKYMPLHNLTAEYSKINITIHVAQGIARLNCQSRRRLMHLLLVGHSYVVPYNIINDKPFVKLFKGPFRILIEIPLQAGNESLTVLSTHALESIITPKFAFIDCEMAQTFKPSGRNACLVSLSIIDEDGKVIFNSLVSPIDRVKCYVSWKTGLTDRKLQGRLDERNAINVAQRIAKDYIIVGSDLRNDLKVLNLTALPKYRTFDLATSPFLRKVTGIETQFMGLKNLAKKILNEDIQGKVHTSLEDTLTIYKIFKKHKTELMEEWRTTIS